MELTIAELNLILNWFNIVDMQEPGTLAEADHDLVLKIARVALKPTDEAGQE